MQKVAFIGAGVMGKNMIRNFMKKNIDISFYTRTKEKALDLIDEGAHWCDSVKECVLDKKVIITMVGYPSDIEEIYLGKDGIIENAAEGSYLIDMTTTDPKLAKKLFDKSKEKGLHFMDAPVSGSDIRAVDGTLTIMVGGELKDFEACYPIFNCLGNIVIYEGPSGSGQHTKMANQIAISGAISGVCEALYYANKVGLDETKTLITISTGAAASFQMENMAPKILDEEYEAGFFIKHFVKDMEIAIKEAENKNIDLPVLARVLKNYQSLEKQGYGDLGIQALYKFYEDEDEDKDK